MITYSFDRSEERKIKNLINCLLDKNISFKIIPNGSIFLVVNNNYCDEVENIAKKLYLNGEIQ